MPPRPGETLKPQKYFNKSSGKSGPSRVTLVRKCAIFEEFVMAKAVSYAQWALEPYCIGMKLRALRTQKRLTLSRLAAETGLSTALLSKLETDRMIPTLPTLATISRVYGVGMSYFFSEPAKHALSITRKAHLQGNGRGLDAVKITPLNSGGEGPRLIAQMLEFPPGGSSSTTDPSRETSALVYVLEGRLQLDAGGMQEVLETGDCACMESEMTLAWSAAGKHRCRVLAVTPAPLQAS
jgi:transcriptional regulator with XRE-family HTH domain